MPLENRLSNSYDPSQGIAGGIGSIAATMRAVPAIRAQAALRAAEMGHYGALTGAENARAELYKQQGLKTQEEREAAEKIAATLSQPGAITKDTMGNVVISGPAFQSMLSSLATASKGAADFGGGFKDIVGTQNAPNEAMLKRQNEMAIAQAGNQTKTDIAANKPIVAPAGSSIYERTPGGVDNNPGPGEVDNPDSRAGAVSNPIAARLIATAPAKPAASRMGDYTTTSIRDVVNPNYNPQDTNSSPRLKMTNTTSRVVSGAPVESAPAQAAPAAPQGMPKPGDVIKGYKFIGGDPSDKNNWQVASQ